MAPKAVSFGDLYAKNAKQRRSTSAATPAATPGFRPLTAEETPLDAESTLPPSSTPEAEDTPPEAAPVVSTSSPSSLESSPEGTEDSFPPLDETPKEGASPVDPTTPAETTPVDPTPVDPNPVTLDSSVKNQPPPPRAGPMLASQPAPPAAAGPAPIDVAAPPSPPGRDFSSPSGSPPLGQLVQLGDVTPSTAEDRLKALGVTAPQIPGTNVLPDGRTVVVAQRQCISMHEVSPACKAAISSPDFLRALQAARASVQSVLRDQSSGALDVLKQRLTALSSQQLSTCDAGAAADLQAALSDIDSWSEAQTRLAAASAAVTRTQKAVEAAEAAANEARSEYQRQQEAANQAQQSRGAALSQQLPRLYKSLKKWETLASSLAAAP